jgi:glycosyltransferase involved in cell wall biosynthesis
MKLLYTANARIPSEKAHPYQIVQMCEAFADAGAEVTLLYAGRRNPPQLATEDIWGYYAVQRNFAAERVPVLDVYALAEHLPRPLARLWTALAAMLVQITYHLTLLPRLSAVPDAVIYSRDAVTLALIAALLPRRAPRAFYEAHTFPATGFGLRLRRWMARRVGGIVTITGHLAQRYRALGVPAEGVLVAHDGFRAARFAIEGDRAYWRGHYGWPQDAFIVGYAGRFFGGQTGIEKGIGTLVEAFEALSADESPRRAYLALVGGPEPCLDPLRARLGERLLAPGMVPPDAVPGYLRAFDVCAMTPPWNDFFAYYTSPLKLFEYMASGTPLVASDLPSTAEVIRDGVNGLLVPPSDAAALADALRRLRDDPALGQRLAAQAAREVQDYTWDARARCILDFVAGAV